MSDDFITVFMGLLENNRKYRMPKLIRIALPKAAISIGFKVSAGSVTYPPTKARTDLLAQYGRPIGIQLYQLKIDPA